MFAKILIATALALGISSPLRAENELPLLQAVSVMIYVERHCSNMDIQQEKMNEVYARNGYASEDEVPDRYEAPTKAILAQMEEKNTLLECDNLYRGFGTSGSVEAGFLKLKE